MLLLPDLVLLVFASISMARKKLWNIVINHHNRYCVDNCPSKCIEN